MKLNMKIEPEPAHKAQVKQITTQPCYQGQQPLYSAPPQGHCMAASTPEMQPYYPPSPEMQIVNQIQAQPLHPYTGYQTPGIGYGGQQGWGMPQMMPSQWPTHEPYPQYPTEPLSVQQESSIVSQGMNSEPAAEVNALYYNKPYLQQYNSNKESNLPLCTQQTDQLSNYGNYPLSRGV